jgi:hypothetical protein
MTVGPADLIHRPFDPTLTQAGVTYAIRTLAHHPASSPSATISLMRRRVVQTAAELAVRRWLEDEGVGYLLLGDSPLTEPAHRSLLLGGRTVCVSAQLVSARDSIRGLQSAPGVFLETERLEPPRVSASQAAAEAAIVLVVLLVALQARTREDIQRAHASGQPSALIALPPGRPWTHPPAHRSLGSLAFSAHGNAALEIEVTGVQAGLVPIQHRFSLQPHSPYEDSPALHAVRCLCVDRLPDGPLTLRSTATRRTWHVPVNRWTNLWLYGREIILVGWSAAPLYLPDTTARQHRYNGAGTGRPGAPLYLSDLRPLSDLLRRLRQG